LNHFELLGLARDYHLDEERLRGAFRAIARNIHPDRFSGEAQEVRDLATRLSASVNQAVKVLSDPWSRADYLLELAGGPSAAQVRDVPGNLMTEVMTLREEIEDARAGRDAKATEKLERDLSARRAAALEQVAERVDQVATADGEAKRELRMLLNSIKYYDNLISGLEQNPLSSAGRA
jgi:molecular chaperone HscB